MKNLKEMTLKAGVEFIITASESESFSHPLFDSDYYNQQLPQFAQNPGQAMNHFLTVGEKLGLRPHPIFDRKYVFMQARDNGVDTKDGFSPFVYILQNDLSPNRLFSKKLYGRSLHKIGVKVPRNETHIAHFITSWVKYCIPFSPYFSPEFYELTNPHLIQSGINPLDHYFRVPQQERADANPMFHAKYYVDTYPGWDYDPLVDFITQGCAQLNLPNPYAALELLSEAFVTPENLLNYIAIRNE